MIGIMICALSCKTVAPPVPQAPQPADVPAAASDVSDASDETPALPQVTITLDPDLMVYDEAAGTVTFTPGGNVRSARYTHYELELQSLEAVLGERPTSPRAVVVEVLEEVKSSHTPSDPTMPHPDGGFQITNRKGRVIALAE